MQPKRVPTPSIYGLAPMLLAAMLFIGCSTHARTTSVTVEKRGVAVEEFEADEFIGTPIIGDYDDNPDLDFVLEVVDGDRVFKINVHEDAGEGNQELIEKIRRNINLMEDRHTLRIIGYYSYEFKSREKEYGFLDLKCIVFYDEETGTEEAYFTDARDSEFYTEGDVTVIYAPGHHYRTVHYPRYARPWWDTDGDGIPDRYDPWPLSYDLWYDYNLNYIPDWYDPYYIDYYPYWSHWNMGFWVGYRWYTPYYYRDYYPYGYTSVAYYNDYRTYTRLYDRRYVNNDPNRPVKHIDVKTEALYRSRYGDAPRATSSAAGSRYRGYDSASRPDNRRLVTVNSRERNLDSDVKKASMRTGGSDTPRDFSRNRSADYTGTATTRDRTARARVSSTDKRKASPAGTGDLRTSDRRRSTSVPRAGRDLSRSSTRGGRVYRPTTSSRNKTISAGSSGTRAGSSRTYRGTTTRQGSTSAPANRSRVTSSRTGSSSSYRGSRSSRSVTRSRSPSSSTRASSVSRSRSSGRSRPAPSTRSAPSRSRSSSPAPSSARSSGGSSRSRSSSQGAQRSSSGDRRKR